MENARIRYVISSSGGVAKNYSKNQGDKFLKRMRVSENSEPEIHSGPAGPVVGEAQACEGLVERVERVGSPPSLNLTRLLSWMIR